MCTSWSRHFQLSSEEQSLEQTEDLKERIETIHQTDSLHSQSKGRGSTSYRSEHLDTSRTAQPDDNRKSSVTCRETHVPTNIRSQIKSEIIKPPSEALNARFTRQSNSVGGATAAVITDHFLFLQRKTRTDRIRPDQTGRVLPCGGVSVKTEFRLHSSNVSTASMKYELLLQSVRRTFLCLTSSLWGFSDGRAARPTAPETRRQHQTSLAFHRRCSGGLSLTITFCSRGTFLFATNFTSVNKFYVYASNSE